MLISLRSRIKPNNYYGHNDHNRAFAYNYSVSEYVFDHVKQAGVDSELIEYAQKVTRFPTSFKFRSIEPYEIFLIRCKVYPDQ